jgi:hypothetical protein
MLVDGDRIHGNYSSLWRNKLSKAKRTNLTIGLMVLVSCIAIGQTAKKAPRSTQPSQHAISITPFDDNVDSLPPHFAGHDAEMLYTLVKSRLPNPEKSEFETEAEYQNRTEKFLDTTISGSTKAGDLFAFVLSGQAAQEAESPEIKKLSRNIETSYDAEAQMLTVNFPAALGSTDHNLASLWRTSSEYLDEYIGSNAFGVKAKINRWAENATVIAFHGDVDRRGLLKWLSPDCKGAFTGISCQLEMDGKTARALSRNLGAVILGSLSPPFHSFESDRSAPTIDAPAEILYRTKVLHIDPAQLWLFDSATGRVLRKYTREKHNSEFPLKVEFRSTKKYATIDYSIDGQPEERWQKANGLKLEARQFVGLKIPSGEVVNVEVFVNGHPYTLQCREITKSISDKTDCGRIQLPNGKTIP